MLAWQYYRLALSCGLPKNAATLFSLAQAFLLGNNAFGFVRYYGLSSTIVSQICAIAIIRISIDYPVRPVANPLHAKAAVILGAFVSILALSTIIAFSHIQGLGIAGIGIFGVALWRICSCGWLPTLFALFMLLMISIGAAVWFPTSEILSNLYRDQGWMNSLNGFSLLDPRSRAFSRALEIVAAPGLISIIASMILIRKNHPAAWLTLAPILVLTLPCFAIPIAHVIATQSVDPSNIVTFHRFLLGIPMMLAPLALIVIYHHSQQRRTQALLAPALLGALLLLVASPPGQPAFIRLFNTLGRPPNDLAMLHVRLPAELSDTLQDREIITSSGLGYVIATKGPTKVGYGKRLLLHDAPSRISPAALHVKQVPTDHGSLTLLIFPPTLTFTPYSQMALISKHWFTQEVPLEHGGMEELASFRSYTPFLSDHRP